MNTLRYLPFLQKFPIRSSSSVLSNCDEHNCFHFDLTNLPEKQCLSKIWRTEFMEELNSICKYDEPSKPVYNAVWVHMSPLQGSLLPVLSTPPPGGPGLILHNARQQSISLYRWLCTDADRVPAFATHQLAVLTAVTRPDNKVLLVRENNESIFQGWKFPSGRIEFKESIAEAALRELREETGLELVRFCSVLGLRETCDRSDVSELLTLCHLSSSASLDAIAASMRPCPREIKAMNWFSLSDVLKSNVCRTRKDFMESASPRHLHITPLTYVVADILNRSLQSEDDRSRNAYTGFTYRTVPSIVPGREHNLFLNPSISTTRGKPEDSS